MDRKNKKVVAIVVVIILIPVFLILFLFIIPIFYYKNSCNGIVEFDNPLYSKKGIYPYNSIFYRFAYFGIKKDKIFRIHKGAKFDNIDFCIKIENADTDSFKVLSQIYAKDKNNAYKISGSRWGIEKNDSRLIIKNIDSDTFVVLTDFGAEYSKDKNYVYNYTEILKGVDVKTFEVVKNEYGYFKYAKDKNNKYDSNGRIIINNDIKNNFSKEGTVNTETGMKLY